MANIFDFFFKNTSDSFFDGLKNNAIDKTVSKAKKARMEQDAIETEEKIKRDKEELDKILASMPKIKGIDK